MQERRLAAIMFTDIVGYTKLMGEDEREAHELIRKNRKIHKVLIKKYNGTWLKEMGDGILASFSAATSAVYCAIAIQQYCKKENITLRIGIHEGEVLYEDKDIIGDGVNIASRLQEASDPGCITISGTVFNNVKNQPEIEAEFVDERTFKNVEEPIKIYHVLFEEDVGFEVALIEEGVTQKLKRKLLFAVLAGLVVVIVAIILFLPKLFEKSAVELDKSIAVLPLEYLSDDQSKQYLANGVTAAITGHLSNIEGLRVMPETSVEQYRETTKTAKVIGEELNVSYIIEGSFFMINDSVKLIIQLVVAEKEDHLLYREYDRNYKDIFKVQSEVAQAIAKEVEVMITPEVKERIETVPTENLEAYNLYLQGRYFWILEGRENLDKSIEYYQRALEIDPNFALAFSGMAVTYNSYGWYLYLPNIDIIPQARTAAMKALKIDNTLGEAHTELAFARILLDWDWSGSEKEFKRALELNPNNARAHNMYAWLLTDVGRHEEAIEQSKRAHELDPLDVNIWHCIGRRYYYARDYDKAIKEYREVIEVFPNRTYSSVSWLAHAYLAIALFQKGLHAEAMDEFSKADYEPSWYSYLGYIYGVTGKREKALEILDHYLELSKTEFSWNGNIAMIYIGLGEKGKAFEWLERSYEQREGWMTMLKVEPVFDNLRSDPRFQDLLDKVGFPD